MVQVIDLVAVTIICLICAAAVAGLIRLVMWLI